MFGFIPPDANIRIADVGTGTAYVYLCTPKPLLKCWTYRPDFHLATCNIWLNALSSHLPPTVRLDGLGISFDATSPAAWLPSHVNVRHWDIRTSVPEDLVETYDIVHVGFLCFVLQNEENPEAICNVPRLISKLSMSSRSRLASSLSSAVKSREHTVNGSSADLAYHFAGSSGYLLWGEHDTAALRIEKTDAANKVDALADISAQAATAAGRSPEPHMSATTS